MTEVFRGVTTSPEKLIQRRGFYAWQRLERMQALNLIASFCMRGDYKPPVVNNALVSNMLQKQRDLAITRRPKENPEDFKIRKQKTCFKLDDLRVLIKKEKRRDTFWVSTDPTPGCGGYAGNYVYKMVLPDLRVVNSGFMHNGIHIGSRKGFAKLLTDDKRQIIALDLYGNVAAEYAFLTGIKLDWIKYVKHNQRNAIPESYELASDQEDGPWYKMPTGWKHPKAQPPIPNERRRPPIPDKSNRSKWKS